jgi:hypothetical protein
MKYTGHWRRFKSNAGGTELVTSRVVVLDKNVEGYLYSLKTFLPNTKDTSFKQRTTSFEKKGLPCS